MVAKSVNSRFRLLIADDDRRLREAFCAVFEPFFELVEASTGEEAIERIESVRIDIALLDMHMPERTGLETLRVLKRVHVDAPGILVTADATEGLRRDAQAASAFRVLDKPVRRAELVETVDLALRATYEDFAGLAG